ncbi:MAG: aminopeptidase P family protein, partial [Elusimicrobia bacterium]|nr:aminopeptidase P family protein [Elusimicrobiota bacterium]
KFKIYNLLCDHPPIVAVGPHAGDPHYDPPSRSSALIKGGSLLLIDIWAKSSRKEAIYADITWTGFVGKQVPTRYLQVFGVVRRARDRAVEFLQTQLSKGKTVQGWEVDQETRKVVERAGYGPNFIHRTGHSIGKEVHGNGANMDGFETWETRKVMPETLFSIEPGIYLKEFGIRSEINVLATARGAKITSLPVQTTLKAIL